MYQLNCIFYSTNPIWFRTSWRNCRKFVEARKLARIWSIVAEQVKEIFPFGMIFLFVFNSIEILFILHLNMPDRIWFNSFEVFFHLSVPWCETKPVLQRENSKKRRNHGRVITCASSPARFKNIFFKKSFTSTALRSLYY